MLNTIETSQFITIPGGTFAMGTDDQIGFPVDHEGPVTDVQVKGFKIAPTTVTVAEFQAFVTDTGYETQAERLGWSYVFFGLLDEAILAQTTATTDMPWWRAVQGADWCHPEGPNSDILTRQDYPVTQISLNDAVAYCIWAGVRLPSESEWEKAARGGVSGLKYPWGNNLTENHAIHANTWQGTFPSENSLADGYLGTAPVKTYVPNQYGLYQMIGNVWEWCANPRAVLLSEFQRVSPQNYWEQLLEESAPHQTAIRGGSFLCHCSFCNRFRVGARNGEMSDSASSNLGFRVVSDLEG
ncbi:formylglycine-generating enzyme family protein [Lactiplantibacillus paraxiangfangensis]|uniref:formylglycine-generating enzyme family protein n=1 Tax=Lactiplantibacillus paraxiangfangensis TaxID=3076224 RepID=UPI0030C73556